MRDLWSLLMVDQVIVGDVDRVEDTDEFVLSLYLYDLRTNHRLQRLRHRIDWSVSDLSVIEPMVTEIYDGVDWQGGTIEIPDEPEEVTVGPPQPFYRTCGNVIFVASPARHTPGLPRATSLATIAGLPGFSPGLAD